MLPRKWHVSWDLQAKEHQEATCTMTWEPELASVVGVARVRSEWQGVRPERGRRQITKDV